MAALTKAKEAVKESLLGTEEPEGVKLSAQIRATFLQHARKDSETGELFMGKEEFVNAIAPKNEDYVRCHDEIAMLPISQHRTLADIEVLNSIK